MLAFHTVASSREVNEEDKEEEEEEEEERKKKREEERERKIKSLFYGQLLSKSR